MTSILVTILSLLLFTEFQRQAECNTAEQREMIVQMLLSKANNLVRPDGAEGDGSPVVVHVGYSLLRVLEVDEVQRYMKTTGYLDLSWTDTRMAYPTALNGRAHNISHVRLDVSQVWSPDIELYNTFSPGMKSLNRRDLVLADSSGGMIWVPHLTQVSFCDLLHPDVMNCTLSLGSWVYSGLELDLQARSNADLSDYVPTGQWRVSAASVQRVEKHYDCCPEPYVTAEFSYRLVRQ